jgi:hypothetical protein
LRDWRPVPDDGETLVHDGGLSLREDGLHASVQIIDALGYAPGNTICRVECGGEVLESEGRIACSQRTILWRIDGSRLLRDFARQCALDVIHLWDAPGGVLDWLETGDESLRKAAGKVIGNEDNFYSVDAAWATTEVEAWEAAREAADAAAFAKAGKRTVDTAVWHVVWYTAREAQNTRLEAMVMEARGE